MHRPTRESTEWRPPGLKSAALTVGLLVAVFALFLILTGPVSAAPQEPTMTLARLSELLAASPTGTVDGAYVRSSASTLIEVKAAVGLRASVTPSGVARLTAKLRPADSGGTVAFMIVRRGGQSLLRKLAVGAGGTATCTWKPGAGTHRVVAQFLGSDWNAAASSRLVRVTVR